MASARQALAASQALALRTAEAELEQLLREGGLLRAAQGPHAGRCEGKPTAGHLPSRPSRPPPPELHIQDAEGERPPAAEPPPERRPEALTPGEVPGDPDEQLGQPDVPGAGFSPHPCFADCWPPSPRAATWAPPPPDRKESEAPGNSESERNEPGLWSQEGAAAGCRSAFKKSSAHQVATQRSAAAGAAAGVERKVHYQQSHVHRHDRAVSPSSSLGRDSSSGGLRQGLPAWSSNIRSLQARTSIGSQSSACSSLSSQEQAFELLPAWLTTRIKATGRFTVRISDILDAQNLMGLRGYDVDNPWILQPDSMKRCIWDMLGLLLVSYDLVMIPLQLLDPPRSDLTVAIEWITRLFWTFDIPVTFLTGFIMPDGHIQTQPGKIARRYVMKATFFLDIALVAFDWLEVIHALTWGSLLRLSKGMRMLRILRLLRVARMQSVLRRIFELVNSERFFLMTDILGISLLIIGSAHVIACVWYGISAYIYESDHTRLTWIQDMNQMDAPLVDRYAMSLHWSFSQFAGGMDEVKPQNTYERIYAILVFFAAFVMAAGFISNLTTSLTQLRSVSVRQASQFGVLRRYLSEQGISKMLALRVRRNVQHTLVLKDRCVNETEVELLQLVSEPLRMELSFEILARILSVHAFFKEYSEECPHAMSKVCHKAVVMSNFSSGDRIFEAGETCATPKMYFVCEGSLAYTPMDNASSHVRAPMWLSEGVLWTHWMHRGGLMAKTNCRLCELDAVKFVELASDFRMGKFDPRTYAREFVLFLNSHPGEVDDLSCMPTYKRVSTTSYFRRGSLADGLDCKQAFNSLMPRLRRGSVRPESRG